MESSGVFYPELKGLWLIIDICGYSYSSNSSSNSSSSISLSPSTISEYLIGAFLGTVFPTEIETIFSYFILV